MNAVVQNSHHHTRNVKLIIENGKITWKIKKIMNSCKCYECEYGPIPEDEPPEVGYAQKQIKCVAIYNEYIIDPQNSIDEFVEALKLAFMFTGTICMTDFNRQRGEYVKELCNKLKIESETYRDSFDIVKFIYDYPLEKQIKFVRISECCCNMGHCGAIIKVDVNEKIYTTYGQIMALFEHDEGDYVSPKVNLETCYEYPGSVWFCLKKITTLPLVHEHNSCHNKQIEVQHKLDENTVYLAYGYSR
jgi:hypothetical protein